MTTRKILKHIYGRLLIILMRFGKYTYRTQNGWQFGAGGGETGTETGTRMHICILNRPLLFAGTFWHQIWLSAHGARPAPVPVPASAPCPYRSVNAYAWNGIISMLQTIDQKIQISVAPPPVPALGPVPAVAFACAPAPAANGTKQRVSLRGLRENRN